MCGALCDLSMAPCASTALAQAPLPGETVVFCAFGGKAGTACYNESRWGIQGSLLLVMRGPERLKRFFGATLAVSHEGMWVYSCKRVGDNFPSKQIGLS